MKNTNSVTVFAPASVANVAVGFDILGFSVDGIGDEVTVSLHEEKGRVEITEISGIVTEIPKDSSKNTASAALAAMIEYHRLPYGFSVRIKKGIPLGSGMGGSAASAVGAVVAANALIKQLGSPTLSLEDLLQCALQGEKVASGAIHGDNVGPCLQGGLTLVLPTEPMKMLSLPAPENVFCVLVHPDLKVETRHARGILKREVPLLKSTEQSAWLAGFITGCFRNDLSLIRSTMKDVIIEPQRAALIPGFFEIKNEVLSRGALGFSISGSGPSVFAWAEGKTLSEHIAQTARQLFQKQGITSQAWVTPLTAPGARVKNNP